MDLLAETRQGNKVFSITFPDGVCVPFRLLSWKDFNGYEELSRKKTIPIDIVENTIFKQCCLDPVILNNVHEMRAGVVSTVVHLVMKLSGPGDIESFNSDMDIARTAVDTLDSQVIMVICRAFPAYKPEEVMDMAWSDVLIRLAQAERILMKQTPPELTEPIRMIPKNEQDEMQAKDGQIDVNELVKDGRKAAAEMGRVPGPNGDITEADMEIGREVQIRQKRRAAAKRLRT